MIFLFVIDTSASMNQKTANGMSYLDCAKAAVEYFIKLREKCSRSDRFMLVTCEEGIGAIKVGWKDTTATFVRELKNLKAADLSDIKTATRRGFELLNQYRLIYNNDTYGQGRSPWSAEAALVIVLTDATEKTHLNPQLTSQIYQPQVQPSMPGSELTREMYRWEQRCYTYTMQFSYNTLHKSAQSTANVLAPPDDPQSPLHALSVATGGRAVQLSSLRQLFAALELLATRIAQPAVVVQCEWQEQSSAAVLWLTNQVTGQGYWPFPEDSLLTHALHPRTAHPLLRLTAEQRAETESGTEHHGWTVEEIPGKFPFDKYTIEHSALTEHLTQHRDTHYAVTLLHSNGTPSPPFAYIKPSAHKSSASLYVLPYNYPKLFALLVKWNKFVVQKTAVTAKWRQDFEAYLTTVPSYYLPPLRNGLKRWNAAMAQFIPDHIAVDMGLSVPLVQQLSKIKLAAKTEIDRREALVVSRDASALADQRLAFLHRLVTAPRTNTGPVSPLTLDSLLAPRASPSPVESAAINSMAREISTQAHTVIKNVFEVEREQLREQIDRLRDHVLGRGTVARPISARAVLQPSPHHRANDKRHSVPISEMGNYQEFLKKAPELRPVDEEEQRRAEMMQHNFGNPFALKKKQRNKKSLALDVTAIDEADLGVTTAAPDLEIGNEAKFMKERGVKRGVISVTGPAVNERPVKRAKTDATIVVTPVNAAPVPMLVEDVKSTPVESSVTVPPVTDKPAAVSVHDKKSIKDVKKTPAPSPLKTSVKVTPAVSATEPVPATDPREQVSKYRALKTHLSRVMRSAAVSARSVLKQLDELTAMHDRAHLAHYLSSLATHYRRTHLAEALLNYHKSIKLTAV